MTKAEIAERVYEAGEDFTTRQASDMVDLVFETIKKTLASGEDFKSSGFGKWIIKEKKPRLGRNPKTGEPMMINGRTVVTFKPSQVLRDVINRSLDRRDGGE